MADPCEVSGLREFRRQLFQARLAEPLDLRRDPDREWYMPMFPPELDPVGAIGRAAARADVQSVQLVAGVRGVGRTTGLRALARRVEDEGHVAVEVDLHDLIDPRADVAGPDLVVALVCGIEDALRARGHAMGLEPPGAWSRVGALLPPEVRQGDPGECVRAALRGREGHGPRVSHALSGAAPEVWVALAERYDDLLAAVRAERGDRARLFAFAQGLERLGPTVSQGSITGPGTAARALLAHGRLLALPETHLVLSAPPAAWWVREALEMDVPLATVHWWPACPVRGADGLPRADTVRRLVGLLARRGDLRRMVPDEGALHRLVLASGGVVRELMALVRELVLVASGEASPDLVDRAIEGRRTVIAAHLPPVRQDAVARLRETRRIASRQMALDLLPLLQEGLVVGYPAESGAEPWFDLHPLVPVPGNPPEERP